MAGDRGSSSPLVFRTVAALAKFTEILGHENTLSAPEDCSLCKTNEILKKRRKAKNTRMCQGEALTIEDTSDVIAQKSAEEARRDKYSGEENSNEGQLSKRSSGSNRKMGHNSRTYQYIKKIPIFCNLNKYN